MQDRSRAQISRYGLGFETKLARHLPAAIASPKFLLSSQLMSSMSLHSVAIVIVINSDGLGLSPYDFGLWSQSTTVTVANASRQCRRSTVRETSALGASPSFRRNAAQRPAEESTETRDADRPADRTDSCGQGHGRTVRETRRAHPLTISIASTRQHMPRWARATLTR